MRIISSTVDARVDYTRRDVIGEDGTVQIVVLEATYDDPALEGRIVTGMEGAHGVIVPAAREVRTDLTSD
jgi:hypothetical protein